MPNWLQQLHPTAILGGLTFIGVAVADHFVGGAAGKDWSNLDVSFMWAGGGALGVSAVVSGASNLAGSVAGQVAQAVTPSEPAPQPAPGTLSHP